MISFNLVDQPWIPVRRLNGKRDTLSLFDTLLECDGIWAIEDESPLVAAALHRFLLAVLHRALEGPATVDEAAEWFRDGFPGDHIATYLKRWGERFDLFDRSRPFFQVPGLDQVAKPKPWSFLLPEEGSGNTSPLFNDRLHHNHAEEPATCAEAARAMLAYQTFVLGGLIKVFLTSAPGSAVAQAALVIVQGANLRETLALNLVPYVALDLDTPIWERDEVLLLDRMKGAPRERAAGFVQGYTWPYRSLLLVPATDTQPVRVEAVYVGAGVRLEASEAYRTDPMAAYRLIEWGLMPIRFRPGRHFWRDFVALLPRTATDQETAPGVVCHACDLYHVLGMRDRPPVLLVSGQSSDQAKIDLWRAELLALPSALLADRSVHGPIQQALLEAEAGGKCLSKATMTLAKTLLSRARSPTQQDARHLTQALPGKEAYWTALQAAFAAFLSSLTPDFDPDSVAMKWNAAVCRALHEAWQCTAQAVGTNAAGLLALAAGERVLSPWMADLRARTPQSGVT
ncbi:MAG: type I-E CRISPR-associated protein Cse1/CasA [Candidatus Bipolaricaulota bacterium]